MPCYIKVHALLLQIGPIGFTVQAFQRALIKKVVKETDGVLIAGRESVGLGR